MESYNLIILGASKNPERYSYQLLEMGKRKGHHIIPINPTYTTINGIKAFESMVAWQRENSSSQKNQIDRITQLHSNPKTILSIYLNQEKTLPLLPQIQELQPHQTLLNPGADSLIIQNELKRMKIPFITACSLVLMSTDRFIFN